MLRSGFRRGSRAFTLLELLTVVVILAILAVLVYGTWDQIRMRAERANCTANLRSLHAALSSYVTDKGRWPQCPHPIASPQYDQWWMNELLKMSVAEKTWKCPTLVRVSGDFDGGLGERDPEAEKTGKPKHKQIHYMPTPFDDQPQTPRRWPTQPWLIEIGNLHGEGPLMVFPDGSVVSFSRFRQQGR